MSKCYNKNTAEYKALQTAFPNDAAVNNVISQWQNLTKLDEFPTVIQAKKIIKDGKVAFSLKQRSFAESLLGNLSRLKMASKSNKHGGYYYVNNTLENQRVYDKDALENNRKRIVRYLSINNIPEGTVTLAKTKRSYRVTINEDMFTAKDILPKTRNNTGTHTTDVLSHLKRIFPDLSIYIPSVEKAEAYYNSLDPSVKSGVPFSEVKSFYYDGNVILIKGRVDNETAIEEVLHAFTDTLAYVKPDLFKSLLEEAKKTFPVLSQEIEDAYTKRRKFTQKQRDLELVTQALTRHFAKEYETEPTKSFLARVADMLKWFASVIKDLHKFITVNGIIKLKVEDIKSTTKMSDIAKLLNTSEIQFELTKPKQSQVRYALSDEKAEYLKRILKPANPVQTQMANKLLSVVQNTDSVEDSYSVSKANLNEGDDIVILNEADHTYYNLFDLKKEYTSATTAINGKMSNVEQDNVKLNLEIGNDFDSIAEGIAAWKTFDEIKGSIKKLSEEQAVKAYSELYDYINNSIRKPGDIIIPQVVVHDDKTGLAGTIDFLLITPQGKLKIIDIKTSKYKYATTENTKYDEPWDIKPDSRLYPYNVKRLSAKQKHNLQVNLYRRMLENMGYEIEDSDQATSTYHIWVDITGSKKDQVWAGNFELEQPYFHPITENEFYVNALIPKNVNTISKNKIDNARKESDDYPLMNDEDFADISSDMGMTDDAGGIEFELLFQGLENYRTNLIQRIEVLKTVKGAIFTDLSKEQTIKRLNLAITNVTLALTSGNGQKASDIYTKFLTDSIREVETLEKYLIDENNIANSDYISKARNAKSFAESFEGLTSISSTYGNLNSTQTKLKDNLINSLNRLAGSTINQRISIADKAILKHVQKLTKDTSTKEMSDEEFELLFKEAEKITGATLNFTDITTSSDTLLAVMKKIWHQKREEALDKIGEREQAIVAAGSYLRKLSPGSTDKEVFEFIIETDDKGNHTGRYVVEIGEQYWNIYDELEKQINDTDGTRLQYREILDLENANPKDIEFNKDLYHKKKAWNKFLNPETRNGSDYSDGDYHYYTEEFKTIRSEYKEFIPVGENGYWQFKSNISADEQSYYNLTYTNAVEYYKSQNIEDIPTGMVIKTFGNFPLKKYIKIRDFSSAGKDMRSTKYKTIMDAASGDALGQARKSFYMVVKKYYEDGMLKQIPENVRDYMLGKTPRIQANLANQLAKSPAPVTSFLARTKENIKDFFTETTRLSRVNVDEKGEIVDSLPIMFVGTLRDDESIKKLQDEIEELKQKYANSEITSTSYDIKIKELQSKEISLRSKPRAEELSWDVVSTLLTFSVMAQTYETMSSIEDTLLSFVKVIEDRKYREPSSSKAKKMISAKFSSTFNRKGGDVEALAEGRDSNNAKHARAFMNMVFYDNAEVTKGMAEKAVDKVIQYSSLAYVGFNVFGNFNNYVLGRINNGIESMGQRFVSREAYVRASKEFNKRAIADLIHRTSYLAIKKTTGTKYDPYKAISKYEAFVDLYRMMDPKSDLREVGRNYDDKSFYQKYVAGIGYIFQDAAEYNVQTKMGMAIVMDTYILNESTGQILSLYDAFDFNGEQELQLKEGFTKMVKPKKDIPTFKTMLQGNVYQKDASGNLIYDIQGDYNEKFRYDFRMKIREVNKQIHGNYAYEDRMVIQVHTWGKLLAQFHKWVVPAIRARFQKKYFDENLGWLEGRYNSYANFMVYLFKNIAKTKDTEKSIIENWMIDTGFKNNNSQKDEQFINAALNVHRTNAELAILIATIITLNLLKGIWADDDDDETVKRLKNLSLYQLSRVKSEMQLFLPLLGVSDALQFFESPFATTKVLGEFGDVMDKSWDLMAGGARYYITGNDEDWYGNKNVYYQRGRRAGQKKLTKEIIDLTPGLLVIKKWEDAIQNNTFYID